VEKLRAAGFAFEAATRRGSRLAGTPSALHPWLIEAHLPSRPAVAVHWRDQIDSTNSEAERLLAAGTPVPFLVVAGRQSAGRGRFGRPWSSDDAANLYASFAFRPGLEPARMALFTLWMGVCVCRAVREATGVEARLKWPNDLYHAGRKLGGMLSEARVDGDRMRDLIFGLGLNINGDPTRWDPAVRARATTLAEAAGKPPDANAVAGHVLAAVASACRKFTAGDWHAGFAEAWGEVDLLRGREVRVSSGGTVTEGTATGIDDEGALLVRTQGRRLLRFRAGEVTLAQQ
jgi:BirA family biotin operon repressor/biotin-[acetyl-CoA-carboxylase] ligase